MKKYLFIVHVRNNFGTVEKIIIEALTKEGALRFFLADALAIDYYDGTENYGALLKEVDELILFCRVKKYTMHTVNAMLTGLNIPYTERHENTLIDRMTGEQLSEETF